MTKPIVAQPSRFAHLAAAPPEAVKAMQERLRAFAEAAPAPQRQAAAPAPAPTPEATAAAILAAHTRAQGVPAVGGPLAGTERQAEGVEQWSSRQGTPPCSAAPCPLSAAP
jgi:hypothetical protein